MIKKETEPRSARERVRGREKRRAREREWRTENEKERDGAQECAREKLLSRTREGEN